MYIVTGVSGNTGKVVAETLLAENQPVTVLVRDAAKAASWAAKGAAVVTGALEDTATLTALLASAQGAYLLSPPNNAAPDFLADRAALTGSFAAAIRDSRIPHVVFLSSAGAHQLAGTGPIRNLHYAETILGPAAANITFLRPAYFLDNWAAAIPSATAEGVVHNFLTPGRAIPMISTTDVGRFAAWALTHPASGRRVLELAGPADYTPEQIAAAFETVLGKPIQLLTHPTAFVALTFQSFGFSASVAALFQEMFEGINTGIVGYEGTDILRGTVTAEDAIRKLTA